MTKKNDRKYFYIGMSVYSFCHTEGIPYQSVTASIRYILKRNNYAITIEEAVVQAIKIHTRIRDNHIIVKLINELKQNIPFTKHGIKLICKQLNVSSKNVSYINKRGYDPRSAIIILYYNKTKTNNKNEKIISTKLFNKIIEASKLYKNGTRKLDLKTAISLYDANINVSRNEVFELLDDGFILRKARKLVRNNNINHQFLDDIVNDINFALLNIIDSLLPYEKEQIYKYINLKLRPTMLLSIIRYNDRSISLDAPIFSNNSGSHQTLKDYIAA